MNTRQFVHFLCLAILASFASLGSAQQADSFGAADKSALSSTAASSGKTKIAVLMPNADNPLNVFAQAIVKGIRAENKQLSTPHEIILLPRKNGQSALSYLQDASLMGASVAIGPITRDDVNEISELDFLPLPVVSLNLPEDGVKSPELLMNFSLSLEEEAKQVASMAIQSLAKENKDSLEEEAKQVASMAIQSLAKENKDSLNIVLFEGASPINQRVANTFEQALAEESISITRIPITKELLTLPKLYEVKNFSSLTLGTKSLPDTAEGYENAKQYNENLTQSFSKLGSSSYSAVFLVTDARTAALIKPRLPRDTRVWGTSMINPGNPEQSVIASLAFDLQNTGFVDAPLILRYNNQDFKASFGETPPNSLIARRLFAFGVDAYRLARLWMKWQPEITMAGTTGSLSFKKNVSANVSRIAQPAVFYHGQIETMSADRLARLAPRP